MITRKSYLDCFPLSKNICSEYVWYNAEKGTMLLESCSDEYGVEDWFYGFANMEGDNRERNIRIWEERNNMTGRPIVFGIAAYWIAKRKGKDINILFYEYIHPKEEAYYKRHRSEGSSYGKSLRQEFYDNYIIPKEEEYNKQSEAVFDYITPEEIQEIKDVINAFLVYLKQKTTYQKNMEQLKVHNCETINEYLENINTTPGLIERMGDVVAVAEFDLNFMKKIMSHIKEVWLMDRAIQIITDTWYEFMNRNEACCYQVIGTIPVYHADTFHMYREDHHLKMPKYLNIEKDLENIKEDELKRRKVNEMYETKKQESKNNTEKKDPVLQLLDSLVNEAIGENKNPKYILLPIRAAKDAEVLPQADLKWVNERYKLTLNATNWSTWVNKEETNYDSRELNPLVTSFKELKSPNN